MKHFRLSLTILCVALAVMLCSPAAYADGADQGQAVTSQSFEPVLLAQNQQTPNQQQQPQGQQGANQAQENPAQGNANDQSALPRTASNVPLIAIFGMLSLAGAIALRRRLHAVR